VPCHRVIAAGGRLGGYGGSEVLKRQLLMSEGVVFHGNRVKTGRDPRGSGHGNASKGRSRLRKRR
jgi:alkylated DNA nucleotide flippase Atl1